MDKNASEGSDVDEEPQPLDGGHSGDGTHVLGKELDDCPERNTPQKCQHRAKGPARLEFIALRPCDWKVKIVRTRTLSADGAEDDTPFAAGDETKENGDEREGDHPVNVASIEELPAPRDGSPALAGKHGKIPDVAA